MKICPCELSVPWAVQFPVWLFHFSCASNSSLTLEFSLENCSVLWEFNTFRIAAYPVLSTCFGSQTSEIPDISEPAFRPQPQVSSCLWGCRKVTEVWAANLPSCHHRPGEREMLTGFPCFVWMSALKSSFSSRKKKLFFLSQNFLVEQQFLRSVVLYDCNLFTSFLYAEHQWEFWELCAKIARSKMFTVTLYENFFGMTDDNKSLPWLLRQKSQHINSQCRCF